MNRVVVRQTTMGLTTYLLARTAKPRVVVGYDGRKNSQVFAVDTAGVLAARGVEALLLPRALPTPVLAYAVRQLNAQAGVMITASHNPAGDNGYKLYLGDADGGSQIIPPADQEILHHIQALPATDLPPVAIDYEILTDNIVTDYVQAGAALVADRAAPRALPTWVYTPMHGVGGETLMHLVAATSFPKPRLVTNQFNPDPTFPTVHYPNPEEAGALDQALALADDCGAALVIANDPDADRLAVAVRNQSGGWQQLSGNDVGILLAWRAGQYAEPGTTLASSIVSTPAIARIAAHYRLRHVETLTGFKWISRAPNLAYGFEEALGYLVDPVHVRDKDGLTAAVSLLDEVARLHTSGQTLLDRLADIATTIGYHSSAQVAVRVEIADATRLMRDLRAQPPTMVDDMKIVGQMISSPVPRDCQRRMCYATISPGVHVSRCGQAAPNPN